MNNELKGIVIDPGHGGSDPGATGNNQLEKDYSLKISKYMYDRFKELGIPVSITRDTDITLSPTDRVERILSFYGDDPNIIVISNHLNAGGGTGAEVIYALRNPSTLAEFVLRNIGLTGQPTRRTYQRTLPTNPNRDYYFIHRDTGSTEPLIIEYGFIDDTPSNVQFLNNNYKELAEAVIKSILEYKNIPYTPPEDLTNKIPTIPQTYIIQKGDTLYQIAKKFNTTPEQLKQLNNLTDNNISIGQVLNLPSTTNNTYTVKPGDTLYRIATLNNTTVDILKKINNLTSNTLTIGQILMLPTTEIIEIPTTTTTYTIKSGDTLYSIAKKYNTTVDKIKQQNNLTTNILTIGKELQIPTSQFVETPTTTKTYTVLPGDTLYSIARMYNTTINNIKELNNLSSNLLTVGQKILISP